MLRDLFAGVEQRSTIAGGVAYKLIPGPPHRLAFDGGLGFEHESRLDEESENNAIAAAGVAYACEFSETSRLAEDFRYVQGLNSLDNWKLDQSIPLTIKRPGP